MNWSDRRFPRFAGGSLSLTAVAAFAVLSAAPASAQPSVSGISGTVTHNQVITVSGSNFGTKAAAAPLVWENFDDGSLTDSLTLHDAGGTWTPNNTSNRRHARQAFNARADFKQGYAYVGYDAETASKWFVQYWIKLAPNWHWGTGVYGQPDTGLSNVKMIRWFPQGSRSYTNATVVLHGFDGHSWKYAFEHTGSNDEDYIPGPGDFRNQFTNDVWHCVQVEYAENSGPNAANGVLRLWVDGVQILNKTDAVTNSSSDPSWVEKRPYIIGFLRFVGAEQRERLEHVCVLLRFLRRQYVVPGGVGERVNIFGQHDARAADSHVVEQRLDCGQGQSGCLQRRAGIPLRD